MGRRGAILETRLQDSPVLQRLTRLIRHQRCPISISNIEANLLLLLWVCRNPNVGLLYITSPKVLAHSLSITQATVICYLSSLKYTHQ